MNELLAREHAKGATRNERRPLAKSHRPSRKQKPGEERTRREKRVICKQRQATRTVCARRKRGRTEEDYYVARAEARSDSWGGTLMGRSQSGTTLAAPTRSRRIVSGATRTRLAAKAGTNGKGPSFSNVAICGGPWGPPNPTTRTPLSQGSPRPASKPISYNHSCSTSYNSYIRSI